MFMPVAHVRDSLSVRIQDKAQEAIFLSGLSIIQDKNNVLICTHVFNR